jgi:RimJ/RimL family protein N-acetyltransferase
MTAAAIDTPRLTLRMPVLEDFDDFARLYGDVEVARSISLDGRPLTRYEAWRSFAAQVGHWQLRGYGMFSVRERATGEFVGRIGPWYPEGWPGLEIGWSLLSSFWGRGYATEAAAASIDFAFSQLDQTEIISLILSDNVRSLAVARRLGEEYVGDVALPHLSGRMAGVYRVGREGWLAPAQ